MSEKQGHLESRWTQTASYLIHSRVSMGPVPSDDPTLVLVHGQVVSSRYWRPSAKALAPHYRVYAPDLPGFGRSQKTPLCLRIPELADALAEWMDAIDLPQAVLVANSLGCQVVADFAMRYPKRVNRLVLQGPTTDPSSRTIREQVRRWIRTWQIEPPGMGPILLVDYAQAGLRRALQSFFWNVMGDRIEEKLPHIQAPTLVVRGELDPIIPQEWAEEVTRMIPSARLVVIPGAAHTINFTSVRDFVRLILTFLAQDVGEFAAANEEPKLTLETA